MGKPIKGYDKNNSDDPLILKGGRGDDVYFVDDLATTIIERNNGGNDSVNASVSFILGENIENLSLVGVDTLTGTGNELDNAISGNDGDNELYGLAGDDELAGGAGNDIIDGGDGSDVVLFDGNANQYSVEKVGMEIHVTRIFEDGTEEIDVLLNVELLVFADTEIVTSEITSSASDETDPVPFLSAEADMADGNEDTEIVIDVLQNDTGDALTVTSVTSGMFGEAWVREDGMIVYQPDPDAYGQDELQYTVTDARGETAVGTVFVDIQAVNDAPEASDDQFTVSGAGPFTSDTSVLANDLDVDDEILTLQSTSIASANGAEIQMNEDGTFTYTSASAFDEASADTAENADFFEYSIFDASGEVSTATVSLNFEVATQEPVPPEGGGTSDPALDRILEAMLPGGSGDTDLRWNAEAPLGTETTIAFSFLQDVPDYYGDTAPERNDFQVMSAEQEAAVREALGQISEFTNITFVEAQEGVGDLAFGTADLPSGSGWSYYPTGSDLAGDVWLDSGIASNADMTPGSDGFNTMLHEIGHALGLEHPDESAVLADGESTRQFSVMSYSEHSLSGGIEPSGYMTYDIAALQHLYGVNDQATSGDDTYDVSNLNDTVMTIYDSGGWDVLDASLSQSDVILNLNDGQYSTSGTAYGWFPVSENIGLSYGSEIEAAIGGQGNDVLIANELDNQLTGGDGSDIFAFGLGTGNDQITDFQNGFDVLDVTAAELTFEDLMITDTDGGALVNFDESSLLLEYIASEDLDESDFLFA